MTAARRKSTIGGKRKGAGRPSLGADARSRVVLIRVTEATHAAAAAAAETSGITIPDWWREAAELALARGSTR